MTSPAVTQRDIVLAECWDDDRTWTQRLRQDAEQAVARQTDECKAMTDELLTRSLAVGALSFVLTGSTALGRRTKLSDLDIYIVGKRPILPPSDEELDVYALEPDEFERRLLNGDDYAHWTLRFGLILHDAGPLRCGLEMTVRKRLWPDPAAKARQARRATELAAAVLASGDHDAAVEQCRTAFSLAARWWLLGSGEFPRARSDLPEQLRATRLSWLGEALSRTIVDDPPSNELAATVRQLQALLDEVVDSAVRPSPRR